MKATFRKHGIAICAILSFVGLIAFLIFGPYWPGVRMLYLEYEARQGTSSIPKLIGALGDKNELSSRVAIGKLMKFGRVAIPDLSEVLSHRQEPVVKRARAAECLGLIGIKTKESLSSLHIGLSDENEYVRVQSLRALWRVRKDANEVVPGLISLLSSSEYKVVYVSIETLDEIGTAAQAAMQPLTELRNAKPIFFSNATDAIRSIQGDKSK